uniref:Uncharacterized protein n=1 Tax=Rhizophora mucronata TaxID=61149 RepID=A0A2P2NNS8_RHIMU
MCVLVWSGLFRSGGERM